MLPYGRQTITDDDIAAVTAVLRSDYLTQGPLIERFEQRIAELCGARHAVAVNSATAALHLALRVAGIGPGDRVVTSPNTFLSSANVAAMAGATPDFADIDATDYTLSPDALAETWKPDVRAVIPVDFAGQTADLPAIASLARERGAVIIEDASHAIGGAFTHPDHHDQIFRIGGHPWADATVFSFHPVKTLTTGEGGMMLTNHADWAAAARRLRSHGVERDPVQFTQFREDEGPWVYEMQELGYNYRLTDLQCALGLSQLDRLPETLDRRRAIVAAYNAAFGQTNWIRTPGLRNNADASFTSWHLYVAQLDFTRLRQTRTEVMQRLRAAGVGTQVHYIPVHLQPWYRRTYGYGRGKCPVAENYYRHTLSLPLFPSMTDEDVQRVIASILDLNPTPANSTFAVA